MDKNLYEYLKNYGESGVYPFHMPGHKRNAEFLDFDTDIVNIDFTEVPPTDNLQKPSGILLEAQKKAAFLFGADESYLLANGSTGGVLAAIMSSVREGQKIIMGRNSHMSAFSAVALSGAVPVYVYPKVSAEGILGPVNAADIEKALAENPEASAIFITSPTYEGVVSDIREIVRIAHKYNAVVVVDEAHGAHFNFHKSFPESAVLAGADIVVQSLHKTLPSLTQTAILHTNGNRCDRRLIRSFLNMVNSSSPSYVLMASIGKCLDFLEYSGSYFDEYIQRLNSLRVRLKGLNNFGLIDENYVCDNFGITKNYNAYDISKIVLLAAESNSIDEKLAQKYKLQLEASCENHILAMTSIADTEEGFRRFSEALESLDKEPPKGKLRKYEDYPRLKTAMPQRQAMFSQTEKVKLGVACSMVAAESITPYPPGIPVILPGEVISAEVLAWLGDSYKEKDIYIVKA